MSTKDLIIREVAGGVSADINIKRIWSRVMCNSLDAGGYMMFIEVLRKLKTLRRDRDVDIVATVTICNLLRMGFSFHGDEFIVIIKQLNALRCGIVNRGIIYRIFSDINIDFDLAVELMSPLEWLKKHQRKDCQCVYGVHYYCLPRILRDYGVYSRLFTSDEHLRRYNSVIMYIYRDTLPEDIFAHWLSPDCLFRCRCHGLVRHIAETIDLRGIKQLNEHTDEFVKFAMYICADGGFDRRFVCIMKLLIARGLNIFKTRAFDGVSLYSFLNSVDNHDRVRGLVSMF